MSEVSKYKADKIRDLNKKVERLESIAQDKLKASIDQGKSIKGDRYEREMKEAEKELMFYQKKLNEELNKYGKARGII